MCSVRGIGVADIASTSTSSRSWRRSSFWATPKRCSSSSTTRPRFWGTTSRESTRWVPTSTSTLPAAKSASTCFTSAGARNRDTISTRTGKSRKRSRSVAACCWARIVVGTSMSTWRPDVATLNAARTATSVLPKPTSPHTSRSIGCGASRSCLTASIATPWSSVSSNGNEASRRAIHSSSGGSGGRVAVWRRAYSASSSPASSRTATRARLLSVLQALPPSLRERGRLAVGADVAADLGQLVVRHVQAVVAAELEVEVVADDAAHLLGVEVDEAADAVVLVDDVVAACAGRRPSRAPGRTGPARARRGGAGAGRPAAPRRRSPGETKPCRSGETHERDARLLRPGRGRARAGRPRPAAGPCACAGPRRGGRSRRALGSPPARARAARSRPRRCRSRRARAAAPRTGTAGRAASPRARAPTRSGR